MTWLTRSSRALSRSLRYEQSPFPLETRVGGRSDCPRGRCQLATLAC
jgi:hypothetical protein